MVGAGSDRAGIGRLLDRVRLRVRAWQASRDPEVAAWVEATRKEVAEGRTAQRIADQTPISELAAKWRAEQPGE